MRSTSATDVVEFGRLGQFELRFGDPFGDHFGSIGAAEFEPAFQFLDRRRHDEDGAGVGAEDAFEVDPSQHVDVEQNGMSFPPDAVEFAAQRAVAGAGIDLLPFDETLFVDRPAEFVGREEIVVHAVALRTARCTRSGRDREFQLGNPSEQLAHDGRLARTARSRKDDEFSHETGY